MGGHWFKEYFTFNKRERNGIFFLLTIIFILFAAIKFIDLLFTPKPSDFTGFKQLVAEYNQSVAKMKENDSLKNLRLLSPEKSTEIADVDLFSFNPNQLSEEKWKKLGLHSWQINIIKNYEAAGGEFRVKSDLKKIHGIDGMLYEKLENFIDLPDKKTSKNLNSGDEKEEVVFNPFPFNPNDLPDTKWGELGLKPWQIKILKNFKAAGGEFLVKSDLKKTYGIDSLLYEKLKPYIELPEALPEKYKSAKPLAINSADTISLMKLKGIGSYYATQIIKYRESLGGYVNKYQLLEIYGIDQELLDAITPFITIDKLNIRKININTCNKDELGLHPYVPWKIANVIVNYRQQHGVYQHISEIKQTDLVNEELYIKLAPYLKLNN